MATRRTTMKSRSGTKLYAVRDDDGKFKDIQTYKRAHTADMRHKSKAEKEADGTIGQAANDALESVKSTVKGAVTAVKRMAKRAVKQVANPQPARKRTVAKTAKKTTGKPAAKKAAKKTTGKPAAKKSVKRKAATK